MTIVLRPFNVREEEADHICAQRDFKRVSMKQKDVTKTSASNFFRFSLLLLFALLRDVFQNASLLSPILDATP